jgi:hypothetical protein
MRGNLLDLENERQQAVWRLWVCCGVGSSVAVVPFHLDLIAVIGRVE